MENQKTQKHEEVSEKNDVINMVVDLGQATELTLGGSGGSIEGSSPYTPYKHYP